MQDLPHHPSERNQQLPVPARGSGGHRTTHGFQVKVLDHGQKFLIRSSRVSNIVKYWLLPNITQTIHWKYKSEFMVTEAWGNTTLTVP